MSDRRFALAILAAWAFACAVMLVAFRQSILHAGYPDPDDPLRLLEVRDFLAGQSWFDVTQYRINPPAGAPMHWSRLVDLPIAGVVLLMRPLLGAAQAEMVAAVCVPFLTLAAVMWLAGLVTKRLLGPGAGVLVALLVATSPNVIQQIRPLRVDHHGWQIALAFGVLLAAFDRRPRRSGIAGGLCLAVWLQISLEGLPFSVAAAALYAVRWLLAPEEEAERFRAFIATLALASLALFLVAHGFSVWGKVYCDAVSPAQLAAFGVAAIGCIVATLPLPARRFATRLATLGMAAIATAAAYRLVAPQCGLDAFGQLDPVVRTLWYDHILEGLPLWRQAPDVVVGGIGYPLVGLVGAWVGWRFASPETRPLWTIYGALLLAAAIVAVLVQRAGAVANALAVIGAMAMILPLLRRAQGSRHMLVRVFGSVLAILALAPPMPAVVYAAFSGAEKPADATRKTTKACGGSEQFRQLDALPPSRLMTSLDMGPGIVHETRHSVVASSHHRNQWAMKDELLTFTGTEAMAHAILLKHRIDYIVVCPDLTEMEVYAATAPRGFWSQLHAGRAPIWLEPVTPPGNTGFAIWKLRR